MGTTEKHVRKYFRPFGRLEDVVVQQKAVGSIYGSVTFVAPTPELRDSMLNGGHQLNGQAIIVETSKMRIKRLKAGGGGQEQEKPRVVQPTVRYFLNDLPMDTTEQILTDCFGFLGRAGQRCCHAVRRRGASGRP